MKQENSTRAGKGIASAATSGAPAGEAERGRRDAQAARYEQYFPTFQHAAEWNAYWRIMRQWPGELVADVGCGTGRFSRRMSAEGRKVVGIDFSEASLRVAEQRDRGSRRVVGDVRRLPLGGGKFDGVLCAQVLEHILNPHEAQELFCEIAAS